MNNLATFKLVYETRSFSKAAGMLFIAQPTVSAQIKQLEAQLHTTLFIRNGRGAVGLTPAADTLYEKACEILATWDDVHVHLSHGPAHQQLRLYASHSFAMYLLPKILPALNQQFPHIAFSVNVANSQAVQTAILNHDADLGFIEKPLAARGIDRVEYLADQLVKVGAGEPWLVREVDSGVGYYTRRYLAEQNSAPKTMTVASNAVIVELLKAGFGQSIISKRAVGELPFENLGEAFLRHFYMISRVGDAGVQGVKQFLEAWVSNRSVVS